MAQPKSKLNPRLAGNIKKFEAENKREGNDPDLDQAVADIDD